MIRGAFVLSIALSVTSFSSAKADPQPIPADSAALQKKLATFDPHAVAAARHYYNQPAIKAGMSAMVDNIEKAMSQQMSRQNLSLPPAQLAKIQKIAGDAMKERLDLLLQMSMVNALEVMTPTEIEALDTFYSSPTGESILKKLPELTAALPAMMRTIMPSYIAEVQAKVKASVAESKL